MLKVGRNFHAGVLLAVLSVSGPVSLVGAFLGNGAGPRPCPVKCCLSAERPMCAGASRMPRSCPMASGARHGRYAMGCACSVAPQGPSSLPAGRLDLRFDLPRASFLAELPCAIHPRPSHFAALLDGYVIPPDQPPKALLA